MIIELIINSLGYLINFIPHIIIVTILLISFIIILRLRQEKNNTQVKNNKQTAIKIGIATAFIEFFLGVIIGTITSFYFSSCYQVFPMSSCETSVLNAIKGNLELWFAMALLMPPIWIMTFLYFSFNLAVAYFIGKYFDKQNKKLNIFHFLILTLFASFFILCILYILLSLLFRR